MAVDDAYTNSLLHFDGADASTTFTDEDGRTWTAVADAQLDTAKYKFATASGLFDGTGDYIHTPYVTADFDWWTEDYTIDTWIWINAGTPFHLPYLMGNIDLTSDSNYWSFGHEDGGKLEFYYWNGAQQKVTSTGSVPTGEWAHIAMVNDSSTIRLFINGTADGSAAISGTPQSSAALKLVIGLYNSEYYNGWVDEFRISKGIARWTANFTPPTVPYGYKAAGRIQVIIV